MDLSMYQELAWRIPEPDDVPLGTPVPVEVTYYDSPVRLFLKYDLGNECSRDWVCNASHLYSVCVGMFCIVRCEGVERPQRAQITDVHSDANGIQVAAEVLYVDRGDMDIVGLDAVFPIDASAASMPTMTVSCCIRKLRPTPRSSRWDLNEVCSYCEGSFEAVFRGVSEAGVFDVDLFFKDTSMGHGMKRRNVADLLVARGFASYLLYPLKPFSSRQQRVSSPHSVSRIVTCLRSLTLADGSTDDISITHVNTPEDWYAQLVSSQGQMRDVEELLSSREISALQNVQVGLFCVYRDPSNATAFRARIEDTTWTDAGEKNVLLLLIDFGEEKTAKPSCLYAMDEELSKYPPLALHFCLHDVEPWGEWTEAATCRFKAVVQTENCVSAKVLGHLEGGDSTTALVRVVARTVGSVADLLIREGYAKRRTAVKGGPSQLNGLVPFEAHDPMKEDYESYLNSYKVNTDDPSVATMHRTFQNERNVCRFFSRDGYCRFDDRCSFRHVRNEAGPTFLRDAEPLPSVRKKLSLPKRGSFVLAQMSAFVSPSHFYLIFPFGTRPVRELLEKHRETRETLETLMQEMQVEYSRRTFSDNNLMHRAYGEIVAAYSSRHKQWQRASVMAANDKAFQVVYPDFGDGEWVPVTQIRDIREQFLHLPFQAVTACLADYASHGTRRCDDWNVSEMASGKVLLTEVRDIIEDVLHVSLFCYEKGCISSIAAQPHEQT